MQGLAVRRPRNRPAEPVEPQRLRPALDAIALGAFDGPLGPAMENPGHQRFHLAGKLELNHWNGRTRVQLRLDDAAPAKRL